MAILYVASESMELEPFAERLTALRKLKWPIDYAQEGIWEGRRIMLAANGAGPRLAGHAVEIALRAVRAAELSASKLEMVVSTGFCGALDPALRESQIVIGTEVIDSQTQEKFAACPVTDPDNTASSGVIVTQDRVAQNAAEKRSFIPLRSLGSRHGISRGGRPSKTRRIALRVHQSCIRSCRRVVRLRSEPNALRRRTYPAWENWLLRTDAPGRHSGIVSPEAPNRGCRPSARGISC